MPTPEHLNPEYKEPISPQISFGMYLPESCLTNESVEEWQIKNTADEVLTAEKILRRTGIERRYVANAAETTRFMARNASQQALGRKSEVDAVLFSSSYPAGFNLAERMIQDLGISADGNMEIGAACSGFARGLAFIKEHEYLFKNKDIIFVASEKYSDTCADLRTPQGKEDPSHAQLLFSDGAVALNFVYGKDLEVLSFTNFSLPSEDICMPIDDSKKIGNYLSEDVPYSADFFRQNGTAVLKTVAKTIPSLVDDVIKMAGLEQEEIKFVFPHQPSRHVLHALSERSPEYTYLSDFQDGNFSSASIPMTLKKSIEGRAHKAYRAGKEIEGDFSLKKGDRAVLAGFGAGFFASLVVVEFK